MGRRLLVESLFHLTKKFVEFLRLNHWPRDNLQISRVETSDEIWILFILDYLLELERKSISKLVEGGLRFLWDLLFRHFRLVRINNILEKYGR